MTQQGAGRQPSFGIMVWYGFGQVGERLRLSGISHMALGAEMAQGYAQRSTLFSFNVFFEAMATAAGPALAYLFFFPTTEKFSPGLLNAEGYRGFALASSLTMLVAIGASAFGTRREIPHLLKHTSLHRFSLGRVFSDVRDVFRNRSFRALFLGMLLASLTLTLETTLSPYMGTHFWRFTTEQLALVPTTTLVGLCVAMSLVPIVTRRFDK